MKKTGMEGGATYVLTVVGYAPWLVVMLRTFGRTAVELWLLIVSVCMPGYLGLYRADALCAETQGCIAADVSHGDVLLTDGEHLAWTVLGYYVPGIGCQKVEEGFVGAVLDHGKRYWLVWTENLTEKEVRWLWDAGYAPTEVYHDGMLGDDRVHRYRLDDRP